MSKERVVPSISWMTNMDNGKQCGNIRYRILDSNEYRINNQNEKSTMLVKDKDSAINGQPIYARILIQKV